MYKINFCTNLVFDHCTGSSFSTSGSSRSSDFDYFGQKPFVENAHTFVFEPVPELVGDIENTPFAAFEPQRVLQALKHLVSIV